jgi:hypothetical protein
VPRVSQAQGPRQRYRLHGEHSMSQLAVSTS